MLLVKKERRSVITMPGEIQENCYPIGKRIRDLQNPILAQAVISVAQQWIEKRAKEGEQYVDSDDIHVYGPFASQDMIPPLLTKADMLITPKEREQIVIERTDEPNAFAHYLLNANFLVRLSEPTIQIAVP